MRQTTECAVEFHVVVGLAFALRAVVNVESNLHVFEVATLPTRQPAVPRVIQCFGRVLRQPLVELPCLLVRDGHQAESRDFMTSHVRTLRHFLEDMLVHERKSIDRRVRITRLVAPVREIGGDGVYHICVLGTRFQVVFVNERLYAPRFLHSPQTCFGDLCALPGVLEKSPVPALVLRPSSKRTRMELINATWYEVRIVPENSLVNGGPGPECDSRLAVRSRLSDRVEVLRSDVGDGCMVLLIVKSRRDAPLKNFHCQRFCAARQRRHGLTEKSTLREALHRARRSRQRRRHRRKETSFEVIAVVGFVRKTAVVGLGNEPAIR
mmetsp:Transcript_25748/g.64890  ORF Transcript_25748/g.64890 Transcript_25748/m.64890 type:complete len:323 (-) Transcript_25748:335-1303(-)